MATFLLVHGAWLGGWCYKRVARLLRGAGHDVYTPTLTGLGERAHLLSPSISLKTHIADVLGVIQWEELSDIVLCGHSYAGTVISGVAEKAVDRIGALVFIDAFVPEDGQSHMAAFPPEYVQLLCEDARQNGDGYLLTPPTADGVNLNAADVTWVKAMCSKHPLACFEERVALSGARERVARRSYVAATGWAAPFETFAKRFEQDPAWQVERIACGHLMMLDRPQELADILLRSA
jgi:pimeloyl-ACP methyl ester carboxylesterase